jgi:hypothetical protein
VLLHAYAFLCDLCACEYLETKKKKERGLQKRAHKRSRRELHLLIM